MAMAMAMAAVTGMKCVGASMVLSSASKGKKTSLISNRADVAGFSSSLSRLSVIADTRRKVSPQTRPASFSRLTRHVHEFAYGLLPLGGWATHNSSPASLFSCSPLHKNVVPVCVMPPNGEWNLDELQCNKISSDNADKYLRHSQCGGEISRQVITRVDENQRWLAVQPDIEDRLSSLHIRRKEEEEVEEEGDTPQNNKVADAEDVPRSSQTVIRCGDLIKNSFSLSTNYYGYGEEIPTSDVLIGGGTSTIQEYRSPPDLDYLQELLAIQQSGPKTIGFFGTRNMGYMHQQLIEILSYAMVITNNCIFTSGATGTNAAVIRGALRAERPELLTVVLPQSLKMQPPESQELLAKVVNVVEMPHNDSLSLIEASRLCNQDILSHVQQVICFAFHDSHLLMETCQEAKNMRKIVTLFYLD